MDSLHAQLKHYPHELHDFHADILIDEHDLKIVDFTGHIDQSDFHFDGLVHDYEFWMQPELNGDVDLDISFHFCVHARECAHQIAFKNKDNFKCIRCEFYFA